MWHSRTLMLLVGAAALGFAVVAWLVTRPPEWDVFAGQSAIAVRVGGQAPAPNRARLRGPDGGPGFKGVAAGDRLRFTGLSPDTPYTLEWRTGPLVTQSQTVRTLPAVLAKLDIDVAPAPDRLLITLRPRDERLRAAELALSAGGQVASRRGNAFAIPLPEPGATVELAVVVPGSGESLPLDLVVLGHERLLDELERAAGDLESFLKGDEQPALVEPSALGNWERAPFPAQAPALTGALALLARLRRLAPLVRAVTSGAAPAEVRWRIVRATSQLACAEVLARKHQQPNLGVLDWMPAMLRFETFRNVKKFQQSNALRNPYHLTHPAYASSPGGTMVDVFGGTASSKSVPKIELTPPPGEGWLCISVAMIGIFNSGPPLLNFTRAGVQLELPLVQRTPGSQSMMSLETSFPTSFLDVWLRREPAGADFGTAQFEAGYKTRSGRLSPVYFYGVQYSNGQPPRR